ncbi:hypothetical protein NQZ68_026768 [Dissostichus eleginoides]|nr:hypothetical protein NQZ68_026768 [Dissostichus eleginoides]
MCWSTCSGLSSEPQREDDSPHMCTLAARSLARPRRQGDGEGPQMAVGPAGQRYSKMHPGVNEYVY